MIETVSDLSLVSADGARAQVHPYGAHVTSWRPAGSPDDRLFLSAASEFREGAAIRGGIPVIFPQFASQGPLPKHGFARTMGLRVAGASRDRDGTARLSLRLSDSPATRSIWPHGFQADVVVALGGASLTVGLTITNTGSDPFTFTGALHTYVRVSDVRDVVVEGLEGVRYRDSAAGGEERPGSRGVESRRGRRRGAHGPRAWRLRPVHLRRSRRGGDAGSAPTGRGVVGIANANRGVGPGSTRRASMLEDSVKRL